MSKIVEEITANKLLAISDSDELASTPTLMRLIPNMPFRYHKGCYLANSDGEIEPAPLGYSPYNTSHTIPSLLFNGAPYTVVKCAEKEVGFHLLRPLSFPDFPYKETDSYYSPAEEVQTTQVLRPLSFPAASYNRGDSYYAPTEVVSRQSTFLSPYSEGGNYNYLFPQLLSPYTQTETYLSGDGSDKTSFDIYSPD